jgi:hypothetical protein
MSWANWGEFKAAVAAAGVRDDDDVDVRCIYINTDGCNCRRDPDPNAPLCRRRDEHYVWSIDNGGKIELGTSRAARPVGGPPTPPVLAARQLGRPNCHTLGLPTNF